MKKKEKLKELEQENRYLKEQLDLQQAHLIKSALTLHEYIRAVDASSLVVKLTQEGEITYMNDTLCEASGFSPESLLHASFESLLHPNCSSEVVQKWQHSLSHQEEWSGILELLHQNGGKIYIDATFTPIINEQEEFHETIGICRNITELIEKERELEKLRTHEMIQNIEQVKKLRLEEIIKVIPIPSLILDSEGLIIHSNAEFDDCFDMLEESTLLERLRSDSLKLQELFEADADRSIPVGQDRHWVEHVASFCEEQDFTVYLTIPVPHTLYKIKARAIDESKEPLFLMCLLPANII